MPEFIPIVTIDGPSGSGKGTISRMLAEQLGWHMLDSGALYRVLGLWVLQDNCSFADVGRIEHLANNLRSRFIDGKVYLGEHDVSREIRSEACGDVASKIAAYPEVRAALLAKQQNFSQLPGLVADGRDMGTIVFPAAFMKFYLDANVEERAKRRFLQLKGSGYNVNLQDLVTDLIQRDIRDKMRAIAPLRPAQDAIIIYSTSMNADMVFQQILGLVRQSLSSFNV